MTIFGHKSSNNSVGFIGFTLFLGIAVLPILFSLIYALAYSFGAIGLLSEGLTWTYWEAVFSSSEIWFSFAISIYIAFTTVLLTLTIALYLALRLRESLQTGILSFLIYLPLAMPATVAAFIVFQWFTATGWLARMALTLGIISEVNQFPNMVQDPLAIGIIIAHVGLAVPFFVLLFLQIYDNEKINELMLIAQTLGATPKQVLRRITLPILLKKVLTNVVLLFIFVLGSYEIPLLLGQQSPQMVSVLTMRKYAMFDLSEKPEAFILALLYTLFVLILMVIFLRKRTVNF